MLLHTITRRNIINNRPLVALRPRVPRELNSVSSINIGIKTAGRGALVAVYISSAHVCWLDKADVLVESVPACGLRAAVGWVVPPYWIRSSGPCSLDIDAGDKAVGGDSVEECSGGAEEQDRRVHRGEKESALAS
jgi:hypothetical protein